MRSNWGENNSETCLGRSFCYWDGKFGNFPTINDRYGAFFYFFKKIFHSFSRQTVPRN